MKIAVIGEAVTLKTGFGKQTKYLCQGLAKKGHEVHLLGLGGVADETITEFSQWNATYFNVKQIDDLLCVIKPDAIVSFTFLGHQVALMQSVAMACNVPTYFWTPWEGVTLPKDADKMFPFVEKDKVIHLSKYARDLWKNVIGTEYIYHGIDLKTFRVLNVDEKDAAKRKWGKKLRVRPGSDLLIVAVDRNDKRKRWDLIFSYLRTLVKLGVDNVQLIAVVWPKNFADNGGYNLPELAKLYGVEEHVTFTEDYSNGPVSEQDLVELYNICDFRVSCSSGEGFGVPTVEAMACGCVNVVSHNTTFSELVEKSGIVAPCAGLDSMVDSLWGIADTRQMALKTVDLYKNKTEYSRLKNEGLYRASYFNIDDIVTAWDNLLTAHKENKKNEYWYTNRFGFGRTGLVYNHYQIWSRVLKELCGSDPVVNLFSHTGKFIDFSAAYGVKMFGVEDDPKALAYCSPQALAHTFVAPADKPALPVGLGWPEGKCLCAIDCIDLFPPEIRKDALKAFTNYEWLFIRMNPSYKFGAVQESALNIKNYLISLGMNRRIDLEQMICKKLNITELGEAQIWQNHADTSVIPLGFRQ